MLEHESVAVVGAGLVGCLTALAFSAKGYNVTVFEMRQDPRHNDKEKSLRSINLAVSDRGIRAMKYVDEEMTGRIMDHVIPMKGRMIHDATGSKQESQIYGLFGESINSIDRLFLNVCFLNELDSVNVKVNFGYKLVGLGDVVAENARPYLEFQTPEGQTDKMRFDFIVGADGAHSQFRYQLQKHMRMDFSQKYIDMQYMELSIPPVEKEDPKSPKRFAIDPNHLHIWPRKDFMLIALANGDGSFTSTFFSPWGIIEGMKSDDEFISFFKSNFPDAYKLIGEEALRKAFNCNVRGSLMQVGMSPYTSPNNRAIVIGDAAHSMVPFYGQGMNCGFEDVHVMMKLIDENNGNVKAALSEYTKARADDLQTICKLAFDNYYEMSTKVIDPFYLFRKKIDHFLGKYVHGRVFTWIPMYTMISFRGDISYAEAVRIEKRQKQVLNWIEYITLGSAVVFGISKAAQAWDRLSR